MIAKKPLHIQSATNRIQLSSTNGEHFQPRFHFHKVNYNAYYDCAGTVTFTRVFGAFSLCTKYFHRCLSDDLLIFNQKSIKNCQFKTYCYLLFLTNLRKKNTRHRKLGHN